MVHEALSGEVELADGSTVEIPRPDQVFPTFADIDGTSGVQIEDGRFKITDESPAEITLAGANADMDVTEIEGPVATIHAQHQVSDDVYAELAFDDVAKVKALRDSLTLLLRYWGENDD